MFQRHNAGLGSQARNRTRRHRGRIAAFLVVAVCALALIGPVGTSWADTTASAPAPSGSLQAQTVGGQDASAAADTSSGEEAARTEGSLASAAGNPQGAQGETAAVAAGAEQSVAGTSADGSGEIAAADSANDAGRSGETQADKASAAAKKAPAADEALPQGSPVYADGRNGSDSNSGTQDSPVKTFDRAKELLSQTGGDVIYASGALSPTSGGQTWSLDGKTLKRAADYHGDLVQVTKDLTLTDIVLDGARDEGEYGLAASAGDGNGGSLAYVENATLTLGSGAILQNNRVEDRGHWYFEAGGGVFVRNGTLNIAGGIIRNNEAVQGGGVFAIYQSTVNLTAGSIEGNHSLCGDARPQKGYGGGVCLWDGPHMTMSGGSIVNNHADMAGGGVSVGTRYCAENDAATFTMAGGLIDGNISDGCGGGIYVQCGYPEGGNSMSGKGTYSIARITGGTISNNTMTDQSNVDNRFGGGGIYVNGYGEQYGFHNGELYLENVEISGNTADRSGGGLAACPVSKVKVWVNNGAVLFGNDASDAREIYILSSQYLGAHSGNPPYEISPSMLGGGAYKWFYSDGTEVPLNELAGILDAAQNQSLRLDNGLSADDAAVQTALSLAKAHIVNNYSATSGGGIGSNGSVFIGSSPDTTQIEAAKVWNDDDDAEGVRPSSVTFELYRNGQYMGFQVVSADDGWKTRFSGLPTTDADGNAYAYTVQERQVEGYTATVSGNAADGFVVTNTPGTPDVPDNPPTPPDTPGTPDTPDNPPSTPDQPDNPPTTPDQPQAPPTPPDQPETPSTPDNPPATPDQPDAPSGQTEPSASTPATGDGMPWMPVGLVLVAAGCIATIAAGARRRASREGANK